MQQSRMGENYSRLPTLFVTVLLEHIEHCRGVFQVVDTSLLDT